MSLERGDSMLDSFGSIGLPDFLEVDNYFPDVIDSLEYQGERQFEIWQEGNQSNTQNQSLPRQGSTQQASNISSSGQSQLQGRPQGIESEFKPFNSIPLPQITTGWQPTTQSPIERGEQYLQQPVELCRRHTANTCVTVGGGLAPLRFGITPSEAKAAVSINCGQNYTTDMQSKSEELASGQKAESVAYNDDTNGKKRRPNKAPASRQQQLNKQAQQRYRQRKKQKAAELENTVQGLANQVSELQRVREQKEELQHKLSDLERIVQEKEAELCRLQHEGASKGAGKEMNEVELDQEAKLLVQEYHSKVKELSEMMKEFGVSSPEEAKGRVLSDSQEAQLAGLIKDVMIVCMKSVQCKKVDVWGLINATIDHAKVVQHDAPFWTSLVSSLQLTQTQKTRLLELRAEQLRKLEKLYIERQGLNLEAISVLLPQDRGGSAPVFPGASQSCVSYKAFFARMKHQQRTRSVLASLKENLRSEQRLVTMMDHIVFLKLLKPVQGAWFTVASYPEHCDVLALLNTLAAMAEGGEGGGADGEGAST